MLMTVALARSGERCTSMVVSERAPETLPNLASAPARVSEPMTRKLAACCWRAGSRICGSCFCSTSLRVSWLLSF